MRALEPITVSVLDTDQFKEILKKLEKAEQEIKELRESLEVALGQSKDETLRSSLIVMLMAETLEKALKK